MCTLHRSAIGCAVLLLLLAGTSRFFAQNARAPDQKAAEVSELKEKYAVYSAVFSDLPLSHPDENAKYLIVDITLTINNLNEDSSKACQSLVGSHIDLTQIYSNIEQHKNDQAKLKPMFTLLKPYVLLPQEKAKRFLGWQPLGKTQNDPDFQGAQDLIRFSDVFFNKEQNRAMVYVSAICGTLCGLWGWHGLVKSNGHWQIDPAIICEATIN